MKKSSAYYYNTLEQTSSKKFMSRPYSKAKYQKNNYKASDYPLQSCCYDKYGLRISQLSHLNHFFLACWSRTLNFLSPVWQLRCLL